MRIILLTAAGPWSGAEVHTLSLAKTLVARGHHVKLIELGRRVYARKEGECPNIIFLPLDADHRDDIALSSLSERAWREVLGKLDGDVAVLVKGEFGIGSMALDRAARASFGAYVTIEHLVFPLGEKRSARYFAGIVPGIGLWWYRQSWRGWKRSLGPSRVIAISNHIAATLTNDYRFPKSKIAVVRNGVDPTLFRRNLADRLAMRSAWNIPTDAFVFGSVGRLSAMKNHADAIRQLAKLVEQVPDRDLRLVLIGDGPLRQQLERLADGLGIASHVVFHGFTDQPAPVYSGIDVFVMPSHNEGLALTLLEAMSSECASIATKVGGLPEAIKDSSMGWLIPPGDEDALLGAMIASVALSRTELAAMGRNARCHIIDNFDGATQLARCAEVIETASLTVSRN